MKYFMTGGTGFVSAYIIRELLQSGHDVVATDLSLNTSFVKDVVADETLIEKVSFARCDVTDLPMILSLIKKHKPQRIIHQATLLGAASDANPLLAIKVICEGTYNVFSAAVALDIEKVVFASSANVTGQPQYFPDGEIPNDAFLTSMDFYGVCKIVTEHLARLFRKNHGLDCTGVRYMSVYGYGKAAQVARGSLSPFHLELIEKPALGEPGHSPYGDALLDWIYVEDAARATVQASEIMNNPSVGLNICGQRATVSELADTVRHILPDAQISVEPGDWAFPPYTYKSDVTQAEIGYKPQFTLEEGLRSNINMLRVRNNLPEV